MPLFLPGSRPPAGSRLPAILLDWLDWLDSPLLLSSSLTWPQHHRENSCRPGPPSSSCSKLTWSAFFLLPYQSGIGSPRPPSRALEPPSLPLHSGMIRTASSLPSVLNFWFCPHSINSSHLSHLKKPLSRKDQVGPTLRTSIRCVVFHSVPTATPLSGPPSSPIWGCHSPPKESPVPDFAPAS